MKTVLVSGVVAMACALAFAKLPPPDDAAKAKAAETAAKAAWQAKVDGYLLCKAQDKVAAYYMKTAAKKPAAPAAGAPAAPAAAAPAAAGAPVATATAAAAPAPAAPAAPATAAPAQPAASGTPVAAKPPAPCVDPGPFAQKPLEAAGAHSPSGTAASPPSGNQPSSAMAPEKK